jgi:hypothetical protein
MLMHVSHNNNCGAIDPSPDDPPAVDAAAGENESHARSVTTLSARALKMINYCGASSAWALSVRVDEAVRRVAQKCRFDCASTSAGRPDATPSATLWHSVCAKINLPCCFRAPNFRRAIIQGAQAELKRRAALFLFFNRLNYWRRREIRKLKSCSRS